MQCQGVVTRERKTTIRTEKSAISFVLINEDMVDKVESIKVDENKKHAVRRITKTKKGNVIQESYHNAIITKMKLPWNKSRHHENIEFFNLNKPRNWSDPRHLV